MTYALLFTLISAMYDAYLFKKGKWVTDHRPRWVFRAIVLTVIGYLVYGLSLEILNCYLVFFIFFDYSLNLFWGKPILRLGNTAKWDLFWKGKEYYLLAIRVVALIYLVCQ